MRINVKKLVPEAVIPKFVYDTDAGADLTAVSVEMKGNLLIYGTGLAFEIPKGYCMEIFPRSSISKYDLELTNSVGIIDADYRGEVKFVYRIVEDIRSFLDKENVIYKVGDRIGQAIIRQLVPTEYIEVGEINESERGTGGFGSSGS